MMHSSISHFKNIIAIVVFVIFVIIELFYYVDKRSSISNIIDDYEAEDMAKMTATINNARVGTVSEVYFTDALFIGDSRTEGLSIYKKFDGAVYFCNSSYGVYNGFDRQVDAKGVGVTTLRDLLIARKFGKIYISLGINNLSADIETHKKKYREFIDKIIEYQNDAIIILLANMHVSMEQCADEYINNENIDKVNAFMREFADGKTIYYLDVNPYYDDEYGYLPQELCYDGCHVYIKHYDRYIDFLLSHGIMK